jgi:ubiquinone/menaquinone biosynthesis C-methylase UbiE
VVAPEWYLDELAHAGPEHLDDAYVATYDRKAGFDPGEDIEKLAALGLDDTKTLVDLGAGTGALALAAAPLCRRVVAVDVSPAMLAALQREAGRRCLANLECVQSGFLSYQHTGEPADFVYTRHALHQLPDFWKVLALSRIADSMRVGGVLRVRDLFLSCSPAEVEDVVVAWLAGAAERAESGWTRAEYATHLREEYSTFTWLFESMLTRAGFSVKESWCSPSRMYAAYTCVRIR